VVDFILLYVEVVVFVSVVRGGAIYFWLCTFEGSFLSMGRRVLRRVYTEIMGSPSCSSLFLFQPCIEELNIALCGVSNKPTLENFKVLGEKFYKQRPELPVLSASTLLIPGYVDCKEVENIAKFISEIDPNIPYTLLAFYPCYVMNDLPTTSKKQAMECQRVAEKHLKNTRIGNFHLLA
jgi:pyruvate formate lyase activating enzyme